MSPKKDATKAREPSFEEGMNSLESIVSRLEKGNLPLEESLASFEAGIGLLRSLHGRLGDVEKRVEVLMRDAAGVLRKEELEDGE
jgi:exodeoxyribonuclease VII small subunit